MAKFMLAYHGGGMPETPEEGEKVMKAWGDWMGSLGAALVDGGAPLGMSKTVHAKGVDDNGGANPLSGYSVVEASDMDAAIAMAKGCPITFSGGSIEVAEAMPM